MHSIFNRLAQHWWLIDVCGSSVILLAVHLARTTSEPLQRVYDKYRPTGSDQQEDLVTLGSMQLRQTLALWTLAPQVATALRKATSRDEWRHIVDTAMLQRCTLWKKEARHPNWHLSPLANFCRRSAYYNGPWLDRPVTRPHHVLSTQCDCWNLLITLIAKLCCHHSSEVHLTTLY